MSDKIQIYDPNGNAIRVRLIFYVDEDVFPDGLGKQQQEQLEWILRKFCRERGYPLFALETHPYRVTIVLQHQVKIATSVVVNNLKTVSSRYLRKVAADREAMPRVWQASYVARSLDVEA